MMFSKRHLPIFFARCARKLSDFIVERQILIIEILFKKGGAFYIRKNSSR